MKRFTGHVNIGRRITVYGDNAMHYAVDIWTRRLGHICLRPTTGKGEHRWYLYFSPNATPWAATFAIGPGLSNDNKTLAPIRRALFGHNFDTEIHHKALSKVNSRLLWWALHEEA